MADAKLTALTAASALAAADLFYVSQSAASRKATGTQLLTLVGTAYVPLAGGTMTGALTLPAGSAAAPSLTFTGDTDSGFYSKAANEVGVSVNGTLCAYWNTSAFWFTGPGGGGVFDNAAPLIVGSSGDTKWYRDGGSGLMALRNSTVAQTLRVYGTYTDSSNYERLSLSTTAGTSVNITAETLGTGGDNLNIVLTPAGTGVNHLNSAVTWINSGAAIRNTDSSGAGSLFFDVSNVVLRRGDAAAIPGVLKFGGTTASFAALGASGTTLRSRLADDSADAPFSALYVKTASTTVAALTAAATAGAGARAFVTDANATTFLSTVAAGGANKVPVVSDGTNWLIG